MEWFVETFAAKMKKKTIRVLDVGSYDVNGSYKELFSDSRYEYIGLDMSPGPNVDFVLQNPYNWKGVKTDSYDIVISGQAFEHIEFFWKTMEEMARVLRKNGLLCIIAPNGFDEHRYPVDCYRFFSDGMISLARYVNFEILHAHTNCAPTKADAEWYSESDSDSILIARKNYRGKTKYPDFKKYQCTPAKTGEFQSGFTPFK